MYLSGIDRKLYPNCYPMSSDFEVAARLMAATCPPQPGFRVRSMIQPVCRGQVAAEAVDVLSAKICRQKPRQCLKSSHVFVHEFRQLVNGQLPRTGAHIRVFNLVLENLVSWLVRHALFQQVVVHELAGTMKTSFFLSTPTSSMCRLNFFPAALPEPLPSRPEY